MTTRKEVKRNIMRRIMELRTKDLIEEDSILDILDDNLDTYIDDLLDQERETRYHIETLEKENTELKKELVEKGQHLDLTEREWGKDTTKLIHFKTQVSKAKELLTRFVMASVYFNGKETDLIEEAEKFLKEIKE